MVTSAPQRFEVYWVSLAPTTGSEISKTRPCVVVSADEMNAHLKTVIVAPLTSTIKNYPTRLTVEVDGKTGSIALDQIRTIDKTRLGKKITTLDKAVSETLCNLLVQMLQY